MMPKRAFPAAEVVFISLLNFFNSDNIASTAALECLITKFSVHGPRMSWVARRVARETRREKMPPSVAVIGAGAAGLAASRIFRDEGFRVTVFEKSHHVGGIWRYDPSPEDKAPMCEST